MPENSARPELLATLFTIVRSASRFVAVRGALATVAAVALATLLYPPAQTLALIAFRITASALVLVAVSRLLARRLSRGDELDRDWR